MAKAKRRGAKGKGGKRKPDPFTAMKKAAQLYIRELTVPAGCTLVLPECCAVRTINVAGGKVSMIPGDGKKELYRVTSL